MTGEFSALFENERANALQAAGDFLQSRGFRQTGRRRWMGRCGDYPCYVDLPEEFPAAIPRIYLRDHQDRVRAHVESDRKICIAPTSNLLIDSQRPEAVVREALDRAVEALSTPDDVQRAAILDEFVAYWKQAAAPEVLSLLTADTPSGAVVASVVTRSSARETLLIGPNSRANTTWAERCGWTISSTERAYLVHLRDPPDPPPATRHLSGHQLIEIFASLAMHTTRAALIEWIRSGGIPFTLAASAPAPSGTHSVFFGGRIELSGDAVQRAHRGFRPGHIPARMMSDRALGEPVKRLELRSVDTSLTVARGGGHPGLANRSICILGCGAVGSNAACLLAAQGIGKLVLIDGERLAPENLYRHALGAAFLDENKATGLARQLSSRFPQMNIENRASTAQTVLDQDPGIVLNCDLCLVAVGDDALEIALNRFLKPKLPLVFTWLEPLGLGGHALLTIPESNGCFSCLYRDDPKFGLVNRSCLLEPGQKIERSVSGCAGTFSPFSIVDAVRTATESSRLCVSHLLGDQREPTLVTWFGDKTQTEQEGHSLSARGMRGTPGTTANVPEYGRADCAVCCGDL